MKISLYAIHLFTNTDSKHSYLRLSRDNFLGGGELVETGNTSGSYKRTNLVKRLAAHLAGSLGPPSIYRSVSTQVMT
jgi:hypothetical protein